MSLSIEPAGKGKYNQAYLEEIFLIWYTQERLVPNKLITHLEDLGWDQVPAIATIRIWMTEHKWRERADIMDAQVRALVEQGAMDDKVQMLLRHTENSLELQNHGLNYLRDEGINSDTVAVRAIQMGMEQERIARFIPDALAKIESMNNAQLVDKVSKLLAKVSPEDLPSISEAFKSDKKEDIIEGEFVETEENDEDRD